MINPVVEKKKLAVVILHYGDPELTAGLHNQLLKDLTWKSSICVLDNHAPVPYLRSWKRLNENLFWAGGLASTLQTMSEKGYTHLWFLNNDIVFNNDKKIVERTRIRLNYIEKKIGRIGVYSPSVVRSQYHRQMEVNSSGQFRRVHYVDGIAPLINLEFWRENSGIDIRDNAVGYGVDIWFSLQADRQGWGVVVDHQNVISHRYHSTAKKIPGFLERAAVLEKKFVSERLGVNFRQVIDGLASDYSDHFK